MRKSTSSSAHLISTGAHIMGFMGTWTKPTLLVHTNFENWMSRPWLAGIQYISCTRVILLTIISVLVLKLFLKCTNTADLVYSIHQESYSRFNADNLRFYTTWTSLSCLHWYYQIDIFYAPGRSCRNEYRSIAQKSDTYIDVCTGMDFWTNLRRIHRGYGALQTLARALMSKAACKVGIWLMTTMVNQNRMNLHKVRKAWDPLIRISLYQCSHLVEFVRKFFERFLCSTLFLVAPM